MVVGSDWIRGLSGETCVLKCQGRTWIGRTLDGGDR